MHYGSLRNGLRRQGVIDAKCDQSFASVSDNLCNVRHEREMSTLMTGYLLSIHVLNFPQQRCHETKENICDLEPKIALVQREYLMI